MEASLSAVRDRAATVPWSRIAALFLLAAMTAILVWFFQDGRFFVYEARVAGNQLIGANDVYRAAGLHTLSVFFVNRRAAAENLRRNLPGVAAAQVDCSLPSQVDLRVSEREGRLLWQTGASVWLVDGQGRVMKADDGRRAELLRVRDLDSRPLQLGDTVDLVAFTSASSLHRLLPEVRSFDYSKDKGISLPSAQGWRIYFGDDLELPEKVASMQALLSKIPAGSAVQFIDVRFVGAPYYK